MDDRILQKTLNNIGKVARGFGREIAKPFVTTGRNIAAASAVIPQTAASGALSALSPFAPQTAARLASQGFLQEQPRAREARRDPRKALTQQALASGKIAATAFAVPRLATKVGALTLGATGALGGAGAKLQGRDVAEGVGRGAAEAVPLLGVTRFTDPVIQAAAGGVAPGLTPIASQAVRRSITGIGNVLEDELLASLDGIKTGLGDKALSFGIGAIVSSGGTKADWDSIKAKLVGEAPSTQKKLVSQVVDHAQKQARDSVGRFAKTKQSIEQLARDPKINLADLSPSIRTKVNNFRLVNKIDIKKPTDFTIKDHLKDQAGFRKIKLPTESAPGFLAGVEITKDENGDVRTNFNPKKAALGLAVVGGVKAVREPNLWQKEIANNIDIPGTSKVNIFDYIRTPDRVLKKIGLGAEADALRGAQNSFNQEKRVATKTIQDWAARVPDPESSRNIFRALDGQNIKLTGEEAKVTSEIQSYLANWADRLNLPKDQRIAHYITHIFERGIIKKEFDPEMAKIIDQKVPGSVYDPFLEKRLGKTGYIEDAWRALDAYTKRATRKVNMDPALEKLKNSSEKLDLQSLKYVKQLGDRINLRPTNIDSLVDNLLKETPGIGHRFTDRPTAFLTGRFRNSVYKGALGLNVGSAMRNLTQGVNTYSKLGEKYTAAGYFDITRKIANGDLEELKVNGILDDAIIQDKNTTAIRNKLRQVDDGLWALFDFAEKINRGSAYFGAKRKALSQGKSEQDAIAFGQKMVRDTQFVFGNVDTPVALSSDIAKTMLQFQSFSVKQAEFLADMVQKKELAPLVRYAGASVLVASSFGKLFGMDTKDFIPFYDVFKDRGRFPQPPAAQIGKSIAAIPDLRATTEEGEPDETKRAGARDQLKKSAALLIPAGVQTKKTLEGLKSIREGASITKTGKVRFLAPETLGGKVQALVFGQYSTKAAQEYFNTDAKPLSGKQSETFKKITSTNPQAGRSFFARITNRRQGDKGVSKATSEAQEINSIIGGTAGEMIKERKLFTEAAKIINDDDIPNEGKDVLIQELGLPQEEVNYYYISKENNDIKTAYAMDVSREIASQSKDRGEMLRFLANGRKEIAGKMLITNGVIDNFYNEGLITKEEKKILKNSKISRGGEVTSKITGRGAGAKLKKVAAVKPTKVKQVKFRTPTKQSRQKISRVQI